MASLRALCVRIGMLVTLSLLLAVSFVATAGAAPIGDAAQGKVLYDKDCASCHKADGSGGLKFGSVTSADVRWDTLVDMYSPDGDPVALAKRSILAGKDEDNEDLDPAMPRWQGKLSDVDLNNVIAFLQTLSPAPGSAAPQKMADSSDQKMPSVLPKSGSPLGSQSIPLIAGMGLILIAAGIGVRRQLRRTRAS